MLLTPPPQYGSLLPWANSVYSFLKAKELQPANPVQLPHILTNTLPAAQNGVLMFSPTLNLPVVSINGVWYRVTIGAAL